MKNLINKILRYIFFAIIVRFIVLIILGVNIRNKHKLPSKGPVIIAANHNSHLDTLVLISLFKLKSLPHIHPVAAADYFLRNKWLTWLATKLIGIIPIDRQGLEKGFDPLIPCYDALDNQQILILFPEGTRGEPEQLSAFKKGIAYIAERFPQVPVTPVFMHGLGKALPKGEMLLVPFFCDIYIGDPLYWHADKEHFMQTLTDAFKHLASQCRQSHGSKNCD